MNGRERVGRAAALAILTEGTQMKTAAQFLAVLFGQGRAGHMAAPGDADCRWRTAANLERVAAVNEEDASPDERLPQPGDTSDASDPW